MLSYNTYSVVGWGRGVTALETCMARNELATTHRENRHWHEVTAPSDPARILKQRRSAIRLSTLPLSSSEGLTLWPPFCFLCAYFLYFSFSLAQLYKQIEIHASEGLCGQQVLLLHLRRTPDSSLSLHVNPARTPPQWGGNWTDRTLFTHFAAKMK